MTVMQEVEELIVGDGFKHFDLGEPLGRTAIGICMGTLLPSLELMVADDRHQS